MPVLDLERFPRGLVPRAVGPAPRLSQHQDSQWHPRLTWQGRPWGKVTAARRLPPFSSLSRCYSGLVCGIRSRRNEFERVVADLGQLSAHYCSVRASGEQI